MTSLTQIADQIETAAAANDPSALAAICETLIERLPREPGTIPDDLARRILKSLRKHRRFQQLRTVAHAFIEDGSRDSQVNRQYAQALIETGETTPAIHVLESLVRKKNIEPEEWADAKGVLGRAWKDKAFKAREVRKALSRDATRRAFKSYFEPYHKNPELIYQGINQVAIAYWDREMSLPKGTLERAKQDASAILSLIKIKAEKMPWDLATAGEASLALGDLEVATDWFKSYVEHPDTDAFALAGTVRQLREMWKMGGSDEGSRLLMPLQAKLLQLPGGNFTISNAELNRMADVESASYEKILGDTGPQTYTWMQLGFNWARSVALVRKNGRGFGTGFVVKGSDLHSSLEEELFILTNSHVVSDPPKHDAASPEQITVTFELLANGQSQESYRIAEIVWESPPELHDASLSRMEPKLPEEIKPVRFARSLPLLDDTKLQRVYIIGHPRGGEISFSFEDNQLLDYDVDIANSLDDPSPCRMHYRTPTEPGSSGSPVFNASWGSVGLHHKGGISMPKLNGKQGIYAANEAISIASIRKALAKKLG